MSALTSFAHQVCRLAVPQGTCRQRTDSTHVLAVSRVLNRLELIGETLRHALNSLAVIALDWLRARVLPEWIDRYGCRMRCALPPG